MSETTDDMMSMMQDQMYYLNEREEFDEHEFWEQTMNKLKKQDSTTSKQLTREWSNKEQLKLILTQLKQKKMGISKVKSVQANGTYENNYGTFYKFEYEMEDGTVLTANHKDDNSYPIGTEVEYEVKGTNNYGSWGKVGKPNPNKPTGGSYSKPVDDDKRQKLIVKQSSLKAAIEVHAITGFDLSEASTKQVIETAEIFTKWVMED